MGMKEPHPLQRHWVFPSLRMARSGQGKQRLKTALCFHKLGAIPPPLSVKIQSRYWSCKIFGTTAVRFLVTSTIRSIASAANMEAHQLPVWPPTNTQLPTPFLQKCQSHVKFFCCLSYGHVKVLRNGFLRQHFGTAASLFSAPLLLLVLLSFVSFLFTSVVSF